MSIWHTCGGGRGGGDGMCNVRGGGVKGESEIRWSDLALFSTIFLLVFLPAEIWSI